MARSMSNMHISPTVRKLNFPSGISVGSLGQYAGEYDIVENVLAT